jgi:hypothetical protein
MGWADGPPGEMDMGCGIIPRCGQGVVDRPGLGMHACTHVGLGKEREGAGGEQCLFLDGCAIRYPSLYCYTHNVLYCTCV